jgi:thiamine-phosphate pyrophosphorylase
MYPTTTKVKTVLTKPETLAEIRKAVSIPVVAIGGLNSENLEILRGTGADGVAVVTALMAASDSEAAAIELKAAVKDALNLK